MTKEEFRSLQKGTMVEHQEYGLCKVLERTMSIGVDLEILTPGNAVLGHYTKILETRHNLVSYARNDGRSIHQVRELDNWEKSILMNQL